MTALSSTALRMADQHCPAAMGFHLAGAPRDRRIFEAGTTAHAILEVVGARTEKAGRGLEASEVEAIARATCTELIEHGREYRGHQEPPYHPSRVFDGRDVALRWLELYPVEPVGARYEVGLAVDREWRPVPFGSPETWYSGILDFHLVSEVEGEDGSYRMLEIADHKSSWAVEPGEIGSVQQRGYAVLAWCHLPEGEDRPAVIRRRVNALRRLDSWSEDLWLDHGAEATLEGWRKDLDAMLQGYAQMQAEHGGTLPAIPGGGCAGCPYILQCEAAQAYLRESGLPADTEGRARAYVAASATKDELTAWLKEELGHHWIDLEQDRYVGYRGIASDVVKDGAYAVLAEAFAERAGSPAAAPLLSSFAKLAPPTMAQAREIAWSLYPGEDGEAKRNKLINRVWAVSITRRFGAHKWKRED
jgi:hypothetical protein